MKTLKETIAGYMLLIAGYITHLACYVDAELVGVWYVMMHREIQDILDAEDLKDND